MAASDFINDVFSDAQNYSRQAAIYANTVANSTFSLNADTLLGELTTGALTGGDQNGQIERLKTQPNYNPKFNAQAAPDISTPTVAAAAVPTVSVDISSIPNFDNIVFPDFTAVAPQLDFPTAVSLDDVSAPNNPPEITNITVEETDYPEISALKELPVVIVPEDVGLTPSVEYSFDESVPVAPTNTFNFAEIPYESTLLDTSLELIETSLKDGGFGINDQDEQRLINRHKDRISKASEAERIEAERNLSSRGFTLPNGAHNALAARAAQNKTAQLSDASNEIYLNRSDMKVKAQQFYVTTGLNAQQYLIGYHQAVQERQLRTNQLLAEIGLSYFNANVAVYQLGIDKVRVQSELFRDKLSAAKQDLERFYGKLEVAKTKRQFSKDEIELYQAQFASVEALTNIHNNKLRAAQIKKDLQELKLNVYSEQNKWYATQLEANGQKIQNYRALTEAETVKMDAFTSQAKAHNTVLEGAKIRQDAQRDKIGAEIEKANLQLREYDANIVQWEKTYQAALNNAEIVMKKHGVDVDKWRESQRLNFSNDEIRLRSHDTNIKNMINVTKTNYDLYKTAIGANIDMFSRITGNVSKTADLQTTLASSHMNAMNMIAGVIDG